MQWWEVRSRQAEQLLADFTGIARSPEGYDIAHFTLINGKPQPLDIPGMQTMAESLNQDIEKQPMSADKVDAHRSELLLIYEAAFLINLRRDGYLCESASSSPPAGSYNDAGRLSRQILSKHTLKGELR